MRGDAGHTPPAFVPGSLKSDNKQRAVGRKGGVPWLVPVSLGKHGTKGSPSTSGSSSVNGGNSERTLASTTGWEALLWQARTSGGVSDRRAGPIGSSLPIPRDHGGDLSSERFRNAPKATQPDAGRGPGVCVLLYPALSRPWRPCRRSCREHRTR